MSVLLSLLLLILGIVVASMGGYLVGTVVIATGLLAAVASDLRRSSS